MKIFNTSELILNSDASVYHLHLLPHQIGETIILVGDPDRVNKVSGYFDKILYRIQKREFITHTGILNGKIVTVMSTGIGTDNIDIVLNELELLANYDFQKKEFKEEKKLLNIIRIGTSGCIQTDIPLDSFLISDMAVGIDNLMHFYLYNHSAKESMLLEAFKLHCYFYHTIHPYISSPSPVLRRLFDTTYISGITLTTPGFYAPQGRKINSNIRMERFYDDIRSFEFNNAQITNIEMETAGIYGLSRVLGHSAVSCNAILANRSTGQFSSDPDKTIDLLIRKVINEIISVL